MPDSLPAGFMRFYLLRGACECGRKRERENERDLERRPPRYRVIARKGCIQISHIRTRVAERARAGVRPCDVLINALM